MGQGKCVMTGMKTFRRDPAATAFAAAFALLPSSAAVMFYSQGFFLGPVTAEFGWTRSEFMGTVTIALIALAILYPLVGRLGDRFGARRVLVPGILLFGLGRSEEHTSELQSLMRISYAVFCLKKK